MLLERAFFDCSVGTNKCLARTDKNKTIRLVDVRVNVTASPQLWVPSFRQLVPAR